MPFVDGGKASTYLDSLKVGDTMKVAGPLGMIEPFTVNCIDLETNLIDLEAKHKPQSPTLIATLSH